MKMKKSLAAFAVAGLATVVVPMPAEAETTVGFSSRATAIPIRLEIYEPTIPLPATPQGEVNFGYSTVEAASGPNAHGRASWIWPGDPLGEGAKTVIENLGLPPELVAIISQDYPVQSNSYFPGDATTQSDESVPGANQTTTAGEESVVARVGFSPDGDVAEGQRASGSGNLLDGLTGLTSGLTSALTGKNQSSAAPILPPEVAALVDFGGSSSVSKSTYVGGTITSYASSRVSDLSLLAGLITADSINVTTTVESSLAGAKPTASARFGGLAIAGNEFKVTKDGIEAVGQSTPALGLPADPGQALAEIGVTFALPEAQKSVSGSSGSMAIQGLQVSIDLRKLHAYLDSIPLNDLVSQIPDIPGWPDQAPTLKSVVGAAVNAKPMLVFYLGNATAEASAVKPIDIDCVMLGTCGGGDTDTDTDTNTNTDTNTDSSGPIGTTDPIGGSGPDVPTVIPDGGIQNQAAGLPPLRSVPAMLVLLGLVVASGMGWWLQRIGALMLGGASSCTFGSETGIPDLRKV